MLDALLTVCILILLVVAGHPPEGPSLLESRKFRWQKINNFLYFPALCNCSGSLAVPSFWSWNCLLVIKTISWLRPRRILLMPTFSCSSALEKASAGSPPKCIHVVAFLLALHGTTAAGKPTAKLAKVATTARCRSLQSSLGCKKPFFSFSSRESSENGENLNSLWYAYSLLSLLSLIQFPHFPWDLWSRF